MEEREGFFKAISLIDKVLKGELNKDSIELIEFNICGSYNVLTPILKQFIAYIEMMTESSLALLNKYRTHQDRRLDIEGVKEILSQIETTDDFKHIVFEDEFTEEQLKEFRGHLLCLRNQFFMLEKIDNLRQAHLNVYFSIGANTLESREELGKKIDLLKTEVELLIDRVEDCKKGSYTLTRKIFYESAKNALNELFKNLSLWIKHGASSYTVESTREGTRPSKKEIFI